ncbi:MAG TPA: hypothetical protein VHE30_22860 [Polyangiaceae bacterium]|nr:hypothetical protein [Polyangiaceae bacterium]
MQRSETLYQEHRYIEAAEAFERTEDRLPTWSLDERASYGLYRGLTFLHLDDLSSARRWLGYAYAVEHDAPGSLPREDRALLDRGWTELDQRVRAAGVERGPDRAVAETAPDERSTPLAPSNGRRSLVVP